MRAATHSHARMRARVRARASARVRARAHSRPPACRRACSLRIGVRTRAHLRTAHMRQEELLDGARVGPAVGQQVDLGGHHVNARHRLDQRGAVLAEKLRRELRPPSNERSLNCWPAALVARIRL
eukprot:3562937-Pleurochrysis_carterae.AAC.1